MVASGHFQDSIEPPSAFDIVVLIVWSRLGTPLPERTKVREYRGMDGRAPVTGTEWEYEEALKAAQEVGTPDLLVYRSREDARVRTRIPSAVGRRSNSSRTSTGSGHAISPIREPFSAPTQNLQAAPSSLRHSRSTCASSSRSAWHPWLPPLRRGSPDLDPGAVSRTGILRVRARADLLRSGRCADEGHGPARRERGDGHAVPATAGGERFRQIVPDEGRHRSKALRAAAHTRRRVPATRHFPPQRCAGGRRPF